MSILKADVITPSTGVNTDLSLSGLGTGTVTIDTANDLKLEMSGTASPYVRFTSSTSDQFILQNNGGTFRIRNNTDGRDDVSISNTGVVSFTSVGSVSIPGGSSGQVLQTNGSGVLSWENKDMPEDYTTTGPGTSLTLNGNADHNLEYTMNGATTISSSNLTASKIHTFVIKLRQDGTGSHAVTLPTGTVWAYGTTPTFPTAASSMCKFVLETWDAGTSWEGSWIGADYA